ncbi:CHAT domain-containing protein [Aspergillus karnatakaensis]|uniref:CHAT domain-containing protein n=1 Tax=Aspergillus karnatakaensis TaxID=1810916 RepID=UPI003CCD0526
MQDAINSIPDSQMRREYKQNWTARDLLYNPTLIAETPSNKSYHCAWWKNMFRNAERLILDDSISCDNIEALIIIANITELRGPSFLVRSLQAFDGAKRRIDDFQIDVPALLVLRLSHAIAVLTTASLLPDYEDIRSLLSQYETEGSLNDRNSKDAHGQAAIAYFCFGFHLMRIAHQRGNPGMEILHEARKYHAKAFGIIRFLGYQRDTRALNMFTWGLRHTWMWDGMINGNVKALDSALTCFASAQNRIDNISITRESEDVDALALLESRLPSCARFNLSRLLQDASLCCLKGVSISTSEEQRTLFATRAWNFCQRHRASTHLDILSLTDRSPPQLAALLSRDYRDQHRLRLLEAIGYNDLLMEPLVLKRVALQSHLQGIREKMRPYPLLEAFLLFHYGIEASSKLWTGLEIVAQPGTARVVFVDWIVCEPHIYMCSLLTATDPPTLNLIPLHRTIDEVSGWIEANFNSAVLSDNNSAGVRLRALSHLVSPLLQVSNPGDLIVLCPAGPVAKLPLHALEATKGRTLLDRNPIVYTASQSIMSYQANMRIGDTTVRQLFDPWKVCLFSMYDHEDKSSNLDRRAVDELAECLGCTAEFCSRPTFPLFRDQAQDANVIIFYGRTVSSTIPRYQALVLSNSHDVDDSCSTSLNHPTNDQLLTVRKIFDQVIFTRSPLVVIVTYCEKDEDIMLGDEPLGLNTALLYAGAHAVISPLWPVRDVDGAHFANFLFQDLNGQADTARSQGTAPVVNLAIALQRVSWRMRNMRPTQAPYQWAPFVLSGQWEYLYDRHRRRT